MVDVQCGVPSRHCTSVLLNCISQLYFSSVFLKCISQLYFSTVFLNCKCSGCSIEYKWLAMQCVPTRQRIRLVSCIFQTTPLCPASLISTFFSLSFFQLLFNFPTTLVQLFNFSNPTDVLLQQLVFSLPPLQLICRLAAF